MIVFIVVILAMIGVFSLRLYKTQAAVTEDSLVAADADSMEYQSTVEAARGNILDRNGNVLVSNRASYNLVIINFVFFNAPDPNGNLLKVLNLCDELGIAYESHFPVSAERPYTYTDTDDTAWQGYFRSFLASRSYDLDISAPTLMKRLRDEYKIPDDWTQQDVYRVISVRYELELRSVDEIGMENYMLAEDVDAESLAAVMELAVPGVVVENGTVREYNTTYAAHILGYIGPIWSEEAAEYREKGYSMNALVGKSGVEQAFEEYLHGSSGIKRTTVSSTGEILNRYYVTEPVPGNNVELTIDISLQAVAEQALEKVILDLRENGVGRNKEGKDARGGAVRGGGRQMRAGHPAPGQAPGAGGRHGAVSGRAGAGHGLRRRQSGRRHPAAAAAAHGAPGRSRAAGGITDHRPGGGRPAAPAGREAHRPGAGGLLRDGRDHHGARPEKPGDAAPLSRPAHRPCLPGQGGHVGAHRPPCGRHGGAGTAAGGGDAAAKRPAP